MRLLRRLGCALLLLLWFSVLLIPCMAFALAARGELGLRIGPLPGQEFRLWLIQDAEQAGVGFSLGMAEAAGGLACLRTQTRFLLWRGVAGQPAEWCQCFRNAENDWQATGNAAATCRGASAKS